MPESVSSNGTCIGLASPHSSSRIAPEPGSLESAYPTIASRTFAEPLRTSSLGISEYENIASATVYFGLKSWSIQEMTFGVFRSARNPGNRSSTQAVSGLSVDPGGGSEEKMPMQ